MCNNAADLPNIVRGSEMGLNYLVLALICRREDMHWDTRRRVPSKTQAADAADGAAPAAAAGWMD